jgi:hypothetical protein
MLVILFIGGTKRFDIVWYKVISLNTQIIAPALGKMFAANSLEINLCKEKKRQALKPRRCEPD